MSTTAARLGETSFSVVDVETTGIYPTAHDRVVEVAVVRTSPSGVVEDEYVTLVNPRRDIGRSDIHGIRAGDVLNAPTFQEIAGDISSRLSNSIIVGHHVRFDLGFLESEYRRIDVKLPILPTLCTLELAHRFSQETPSRKLSQCCHEAGILLEDEHSALADARATAHLVLHYLNLARQDGQEQLLALGSRTTNLCAADWCLRPPSGLSFRREHAQKKNTEELTYLARLVERMLGDEARTPREAEYLSLLDRVIEDRRISREEAELLIDHASTLGMSRSSVIEAHRSYLASLCSEAMADGVVSEGERRDLEAICDMLDLNRAALEELLATPSPRRFLSGENLSGNTVCFTGELLGSLQGNRITRAVAERMATDAGLVVQPNVTRMLDILVVADPDTQSGKARKARDYGTRIMAEAAFWRAIGQGVN